MTRTVDGSFPVRTWPTDRPLWRIHRAGRAPWWFSSDGSGRFDPVGAGGIGACHLAGDPLGAFVEVFRTQLELDTDDIARRRLTRVVLGRPLRLADLCSRRALAYDVTASLGADGDYRASQAFAAAANHAGFHGLRWWARHDAAQRLAGVALFGPAGRPAASDAWPAGAERAIDDPLIDSARRASGYRAVPRP